MRIASGLRALALVSAVALAACGGGGGGGTGGTGGSPAAVASTGVFLDAPVINIGYKTDSQNGNTDGGGRFDYLPGESIVFHIGDLEFPPVLAKEVVTPADMGNRSGDPMIVNISRLLHSLDADLDPSNGLQIPERAKQIAVQLDFDQRIEVFEVIPEVLDLVWNAGQDIPQSQLVSPDWALSNLNDNLLAEGEADDRDGDGLSDPLDQFPDDPDEFWDWDEDGVGDNGDDFPIDPTETTDSDGDGVGDNTDVYPDDQTRNGQPPILYSLTIPNLVVGVPANLEVSYFSEFPSAEVSVLTTIITAPVGSSLEGYSVSGSGLTVTPDVEGAYAFRVEVQDDNGGVYAIFKGVATNTDPVASIAMPVGANVANEVTVDGTGSSDPDGHSIEFDWHLLSRPANSNATLTDPAVAAFTFTPDVGGDYRFELTVTDAFGAEDVTVATLEVSGYALERVAYRVVDAEYPGSGEGVREHLGDDLLPHRSLGTGGDILAVLVEEAVFG